jgi:hypothetical protein
LLDTMFYLHLTSIAESNRSWILQYLIPLVEFGMRIPLFSYQSTRRFIQYDNYIHIATAHTRRLNKKPVFPSYIGMATDL